MGKLTIFPIGIYMNRDGKKWLSSLRSDHQIFTMTCDKDFDGVFDMIGQLAIKKILIIPVDEIVMGDREFEEDGDLMDNRYCEQTSLDALSEAFKNMM